MEMITLAHAPPHDPDHVARPFLDGEKCNVRVRSDGTDGLTLLAFLAPPFPPARSR